MKDAGKRRRSSSRKTPLRESLQRRGRPVASDPFSSSSSSFASSSALSSSLKIGERASSRKGHGLVRKRNLPWRDRTNEEAFRAINEVYTEDVHLAWLYHPRSVTVLVLGTAMLALAALDETSDVEVDIERAARRAMAAACLAFLVFSAVALPNGPFVRPHPVVWRLVLGATVLYVCALAAAAALPTRHMFAILETFFNAGAEPRPGDTAADCSVTVANLASRMDLFVVAHFLGWVVKGLVLRDVFLCFVTSAAWELSEIVMAQALPNFRECWWDAVVYDILGANLLGIIVGTWLCRRLEVREYCWAPLSRIQTNRGRLVRAMQQFTPASWTPSHWGVGPRAFLQLLSVSMAVQVMELNAFFLKYNFAISEKHWVNTVRLALWSIVGAPALRQVYVYWVDARVKRLGTQAWAAAAALAIELVLVVKSARGLFPHVDNIGVVLLTWFLSQVAFVSAALAARRFLRSRFAWARSFFGSVHPRL